LDASLDEVCGHAEAHGSEAEKGDFLRHFPVFYCSCWDLVMFTALWMGCPMPDVGS
jgi:hypothetical protein